MQEENDFINKIEALGSKETSNFYLKFNVELGPAFSDKAMTHGDLAVLLEKEVVKYKTGLLPGLLNHFLSELKRLKIADGDKATELSTKTYAGEFFQCGSCGKQKYIYCYIDPYTNIRDCTCTAC